MDSLHFLLNVRSCAINLNECTSLFVCPWLCRVHIRWHNTILFNLKFSWRSSVRDHIRKCRLVVHASRESRLIKVVSALLILIFFLLEWFISLVFFLIDLLLVYWVLLNFLFNIIVNYNFVINFFIINFFIILLIKLLLCRLFRTFQTVVIYCNIYWLWSKFTRVVLGRLWSNCLIRSTGILFLIWDNVRWHTLSHKFVSSSYVVLARAWNYIAF